MVYEPIASCQIKKSSEGETNARPYKRVIDRSVSLLNVGAVVNPVVDCVQRSQAPFFSRSNLIRD